MDGCRHIYRSLIPVYFLGHCLLSLCLCFDESNIVGGDQQAFDAVAQTFKLDWTHNLWSHFVRNIQLYSLEIIKVWFWGRAETFQKENLFLENEGKVMVVIWAWWIGGVGTHICRDWLLTYLVLLIFGNTFLIVRNTLLIFWNTLFIFGNTF